MINVEYTGYEVEKQHFVPWVCELGNKTIQHEKMTPKCYNETKLNCVTLWKADENGNQVMAIYQVDDHLQLFHTFIS